MDGFGDDTSDVDVAAPFTVNVAAFEVCVEEESRTATGKLPAAAMSAVAKGALICVLLTKVVTLEMPLNFTTELEAKFAPLTVSVNAGPPAVALAGAMLAIIGAGTLGVVTEVSTESEPSPPTPMAETT